MDIKDDFSQKKLKINEISSSDYFNLIIKYLTIKNEKNKNGDELTLKFHSIMSSFTNNKLLEILSDTYPVKFNLDENKILVDLKINLLFKVKILPFIISFANIWAYTFLIYDIFQQRMIYNYNKGKNELEQMNFEDDILKYFEERKVKQNIINNNNNKKIEENKSIIPDDDNKMAIEINIRSINIYFDIITKKIKAATSIKNIKLNYIMSNNQQIMEFSIDKIESNEFKLYINEIKMNLNLTKFRNSDSMNLKISTKSKKSKSMNLHSYLIVPEESMEIYIENIMRLQKRKQQLNKNNDSNKEKDKQITNVNISIKDIELEPLECVLYINDIYNVIVKEELYNSSITNTKKDNLLNSTISRTKSVSSKNSEEPEQKNTILESLLDPNEQSKLSNKTNKEPLFIINFNLYSVKCIIKDEKNLRDIELKIKNINLKNGNLLCKNIEFLILYEIEDYIDKVIIDLGQINNINLIAEEKNNINTSFQIIIDEISFSFCKDSFEYIQNVVDKVGETMSKCFVKAKKNNKIVITKKTDQLISTYDAEDKRDQESELFGNNVAKSICLVSTSNDYVLDIDENYLDNLKNEKEEPNEIIDEVYKSCLKEKIMKNNNKSNLSLIIKKIKIGLYSGYDFESTLDFRTKAIDYKNNEKEENGNIIKDNDDDRNEFNEKLEILKQNIEIKDEDIKDNLNIDNVKKKESDNFEIIELNRDKKVNGRKRDNYLLFSIEKIYLSILYAKKNSYELEFSIEDFEIKDNLKESTIKRLLAKRKNIGNNEERKNIPFLSIFVDISNSQNELSRNNYTDFNIACEISLSSFQIMIHQNSLLFILSFFIKNDATPKKKDSNEIALKLYNTEQYHTQPSYILDSQFNQIIVEDYGEEQNDLIEDRKFIYITNFLFREFEIHITYESNDLGFSFQNIYIPLIPDLKGYPFVFYRITYKGFVTINQFTDFFVKHFIGQLSAYNLVFDLLKSLSWTQPIFNIFGDFFDIFISPFQSYRKNQGFMHGLFKGLKKFFFNLLSKNVYAGEKMIRTLTTFIGVTKNNNIGKNSFYEKYILTDDKKKIYDYFYK